MCTLLKLHYAKFDVSRLFCSKVIEEKPLGGRLEPPPPPPVKEGLMGIQALWSFVLLTMLDFENFWFGVFKEIGALGLGIGVIFFTNGRADITKTALERSFNIPSKYKIIFK